MGSELSCSCRLPARERQEELRGQDDTTGMGGRFRMLSSLVRTGGWCAGAGRARPFWTLHIQSFPHSFSGLASA